MKTIFEKLFEQIKSYPNESIYHHNDMILLNDGNYQVHPTIRHKINTKTYADVYLYNQKWYNLYRTKINSYKLK